MNKSYSCIVAYLSVSPILEPKDDFQRLFWRNEVKVSRYSLIQVGTQDDRRATFQGDR